MARSWLLPDSAAERETLELAARRYREHHHSWRSRSARAPLPPTQRDSLSDLFVWQAAYEQQIAAGRPWWMLQRPRA